MSDKKYFLHIIVLLLLSAVFLPAQTTQWRLTWTDTLNAPSSIARYNIYRSTTPAVSPGNLINYVPSGTFSYTDSTIQNGTLYYYHVTSVDTNNLESEYSDPASAAIPRITEAFPRQINLPSSQRTSFLLDETCVLDPDDDASTVIWKVNNDEYWRKADTVEVVFDNEVDSLTVATFLNWKQGAAETVQITVEDDSGFFDQTQLSINYLAFSGTFDLNIPDVAEFVIGDSLVYNLSDFIEPQYQHLSDDINWNYITNTGFLTVSISNLYLTVKAADPGTPDNVGADSVRISASYTSSDSSITGSKVLYVNIVSRMNLLQNSMLNIYENDSYIFSLDDLVFDDSTTFEASEIDWELETDISAGNRLGIDTSTILVTRSVKFEPLENWFHAEGEQDTVRFKASDPSGNNRTTTLIVKVLQSDVPPPPEDIVRDRTLIGDEDMPIQLSLLSLIYESHPAHGDTASVKWSIPQRTVNGHIALKRSGWTITCVPDQDWYDSDTAEIFCTYNDVRDTSTIRFDISPVHDPACFSSIMAGKDIPNDESIHDIDLKNYVNPGDNPENALIYGGISGSIISVSINRQTGSGHYHIKSTKAGLFGKDSIDFWVWGENDADTAFQTVEFMVVNPDSDGIVDLNVGPMGSATIYVVQYTTTYPARSYIRYGTGKQQMEFFTEQSDKYSKNHIHVLDQLRSNMTYYYQMVMTDTNKIIHYSLQQTFTTGTDNDSIKVFPNPHKAGENPAGDVVHFTNLPENASIQIFNLLGEPVFRKDEVSHYFHWRLINDHGRNVQSGLYLYIIKDRHGKALKGGGRGKLVIIR